MQRATIRAGLHDAVNTGIRQDNAQQPPIPPACTPVHEPPAGRRGRSHSGAKALTAPHSPINAVVFGRGFVHGVRGVCSACRAGGAGVGDRNELRIARNLAVTGSPSSVPSLDPSTAVLPCAVLPCRGGQYPGLPSPALPCTAPVDGIQLPPGPPFLKEQPSPPTSPRRHRLSRAGQPRLATHRSIIPLKNGANRPFFHEATNGQQLHTVFGRPLCRVLPQGRWPLPESPRQAVSSHANPEAAGFRRLAVVGLFLLFPVFWRGRKCTRVT